jgi:hypothetical protein
MVDGRPPAGADPPMRRRAWQALQHARRRCIRLLPADTDGWRDDALVERWTRRSRCATW